MSNIQIRPDHAMKKYGLLEDPRSTTYRPPFYLAKAEASELKKPSSVSLPRPSTPSWSALILTKHPCQTGFIPVMEKTLRPAGSNLITLKVSWK